MRPEHSHRKPLSTGLASKGCTPLLPALGEQRQLALCDSEGSLVYTEFQASQDYIRFTLSQNKKPKQKRMLYSEDVEDFFIITTAMSPRILHTVLCFTQ